MKGPSRRGSEGTILRRLLLMSVTLFSILFLVGCSGGGGGSTTISSGGGNSPPPAQPAGPIASQTATLQFNFNLLARAVPNYIDSFRFSGLSLSGDLLYGPVTVGKRTTVRLEDVPTSVTRVRIEFLKNGAVRGVAVIGVDLRQDETEVIDDPRFEDVDAVLTDLQLSVLHRSLPVGETTRLGARGLFNDASRQDLTGSSRWSSSQPAVASVDSKGVVTARSVGQATITATFGNIKASVVIVVTGAELRSIRVHPAEVSIPNGTSTSLEATGYYSDSSELTPLSVQWFSLNPSVVEIDEVSGLLTGKAEGVATVRCRLNGVESEIQVTVTPAVLEYRFISPSPATLPVGTESQFELLEHYSDGTDVALSNTEWTSSNDSVLSILNNGIASAKIVGEATLTGKDLDSGAELEANVSVVVGDVQFLTLTPEVPWLDKGMTRLLTVTGHRSDSSTVNLTLSAIFQTSDSDVVSVSNDFSTRGHFSGVASGTANLTASIPGTNLQVSTKSRCLAYSNTGTISLAQQVRRMISSTDGELLYVLFDNELQVMDPATRQVVRTESVGGRAMALSPDGSTLLIAGTDPEIKVLKTDTWVSLDIPLANAEVPRDVDFLNDDVAYVLGDGRILKLDLNTFTQVQTTSVQASSLRYLRVDRITNQIFAAVGGLSPSSVYRYSLSSGAPSLSQSTRNLGSNGRWLALNPGEGLIFAAGGGNQPAGYQMTYIDLQNLNNSFGDFLTGTYPRNAEFSDDGEVLFAVNGDSYDPHLYIGREDKVEIFKRLSTPTINGFSRNYLVEPSADGKWLYLHIFDDYNDRDYQIVVYEAI